MSDIRNLWLCRNTAVEMIKVRGFETTQQTFDSEYSFSQAFPNAFLNPSILNFIVTSKGSTAVHFNFEEKLPKKSIEIIIQEYLNQNVDNIILITNSKLNHASLTYASGIKNAIIENFVVKEMLFNPCKHRLVPEHKIMTKEETEALLKKLKCTLDQLPRILKSDVIARFLGGRVNDVFEITRDSKTTGKSKYFRVIKESVES